MNTNIHVSKIKKQNLFYSDMLINTHIFKPLSKVFLMSLTKRKKNLFYTLIDTDLTLV